ncbi:hypothetical protein RM531_10585 [Salinisphaera sp. P385]|uniref:Uncharacterized protein n=1 Tax=Spectribacter acetivorans TaxID=3075603 RepID=A0ABU3B8X4_9GAMM|nr:hypothetical protein [Salinisphaera sp. P385]MDT0618921.1 hypothetical protein [Salinisphaera sp. P385]
MLTISLIVLAGAAAGGLFLGLSKQVPGFMRLGHGAFAGIGLALLLIAALGDGRSLVWTAFGLIAAGFAGGAVLFGAVFRDRKPPGFMIAGHGALNGLGVLVLAWAVLYPG